MNSVDDLLKINVGDDFKAIIGLFAMSKCMSPHWPSMVPIGYSSDGPEDCGECLTCQARKAKEVLR